LVKVRVVSVGGEIPLHRQFIAFSASGSRSVLLYFHHRVCSDCIR